MTGNQVDILLVEDNPADAELTIRALKKKKSIYSGVVFQKKMLDRFFCKIPLFHLSVRHCPQSS